MTRSPESTPAPGRAGRLDALDALRALALLGVLVVNVDTQFARSPFARFLPGPELAPLDAWAQAFVASGLEERPLVVFSFLFGAGLAAGRTARRLGDEVRRLLLLLALGALHFVLLWVGDVLALYALTGLVAATLVWMRASRRVLAVAALAALVLGVLPIPYPPPFADAGAMQRHVDAAHAIYAHGGYVDILRFRLGEAWPALAIAMWSVPRTLGLLLFGALAWDSGWLARPRAPGFVRASLALTALGALAVLIADRGLVRGVVVAAAHDLGETALALGGAGLAYAILAGRLGAPVTRALAPIGRVTLTAYVAQSVVLGLVFYGYGGGAFDRVGHAAGIALALVVFAVQLVLAHVWLGRFTLGPLEWAWRSASRREALPIVRPRP